MLTNIGKKLNYLIYHIFLFLRFFFNFFGAGIDLGTALAEAEAAFL